MADSDEKQKKDNEVRTRVSETERIEALRARLYARTSENTSFVRHELEASAIPKNSISEPEPFVAKQTPLPHVAPLPTSAHAIPMARTSKRTSLRFKFILVGIIFFIGALVLSSLFLFSGGNIISGNNISIEVKGPLTLGGGEDMNLQVTIGNQNSLAIESATLIISYPRGAQSVTEEGKELFTERQQLNNIGTGEVVNVPIRVRIYGEENEDKEIKVSIEYRVAGSNATFYKEAAPFTFKVSSSPLIINIDAVERIPSGQTTELTVVVQSNAKEELTNLLVRATYPQGFDFTDATPETASGQDIWKIKSLKPGESYTLKIRGLMVGSEDESDQFTFAAGVANERDNLNLASILATAEADIVIEKPFLDVEIKVNGSSEDVVVIDPSNNAHVSITFKNALDTVVYDGVVFVELKGNALDEVNVRTENGYYDSSKNTVKWDSVDVRELRELTPGNGHTVTFTLDPRDDIASTPEIKFLVTIQGNRVSEGRVPEQVVGTVERTIKIASMSKLASSALYSEGPFRNSGPTPPIAEKTTEYTYLLSVKNGTNPITGGEVTAVMPAYMTWLDNVSEDDTVVYNSSTRTLKWKVGEMAAGAYEEVWIQVSFQPSLSQVGKSPTILETQRFRATDRFTGTVIRTEAPALTTMLQNDPDMSTRDGRVQED